MMVQGPVEAAVAPALHDFRWEETACPLCGQDAADFVLEAADPLPAGRRGLRFAVVRCRHCGLAYTNPRPDAATIARFYPEHYAPHAMRFRRPPRPKPLWFSRLFGRPCPERRGYLPHRPPGRLLDFGCGSGAFLQRMAALGWEVVGVDVAPQVVEALRLRGYQALHGSLPHPQLTPSSFHIVTMWQALEHVHQPRLVLRHAWKLLVPGGYLIVAVPNFASWPASWFGPHWFGLDLPRHLTHFTPETLTAMLTAEQFWVLSVRGIVHVDWFRASVRRLAGHRGHRWFDTLLQWKPIADVAAWLCYVAGKAECLIAIAQRPSE
ncbi:MAG: methyltransferase domain-containing protein [Thermogemmata sp.]|nr:methyltransferase domain-containing protein [Thermogemmata sp.]